MPNNLQALRARVGGAVEVFGAALSYPRPPLISPERAVVVGGTGGIGGAVARALAAAGVGVVVTGRAEASCRRTEGALAGDVRCVAGDLSRAEAARALAREALTAAAADGGCLRALVLSAGASPERFEPAAGRAGLGSDVVQQRSEAFSVMVAGQLLVLEEQFRAGGAGMPWCAAPEGAAPLASGSREAHGAAQGAPEGAGPYARVVFVGSGADAFATPTGVRDLFDGHAYDSAGMRAARSLDDLFGVGAFQAYAAAKHVQELVAAEVGRRVAASPVGRSVRVVSVSPAGSVRTPTSSIAQAWVDDLPAEARVLTFGEAGQAAAPVAKAALGTGGAAEGGAAAPRCADVAIARRAADAAGADLDTIAKGSSVRCPP